MAGDWIKVEHATPDKPEIVQMASILKLDQDAVFGKLMRLWIWADQQTVDGNALSVTNSFLDRITLTTGFADALRRVGWLEGRDGSLSIPNFDRHNGQTSKRRVVTNRRVSDHRQKCNADGVTKSVQKALPEKRREEVLKTSSLNTPLPPEGASGAARKEPDPVLPASLDTDAFRAALAKWRKHRTEIRKPLKPTQLEGQLKKMAEWGEQRAIAIIEHSISNGWTGLFEPDQFKNNGGNNGAYRNRTQQGRTGGTLNETVDFTKYPTIRAGELSDGIDMDDVPQ